MHSLSTCVVPDAGSEAGGRDKQEDGEGHAWAESWRERGVYKADKGRVGNQEVPIFGFHKGFLEFLFSFPGPRRRCVAWLLPQRSRKKTNNGKTEVTDRFWNMSSPPWPSVMPESLWKLKKQEETEQRSGTRKCHAEPQWATLLFKNNFIYLFMTVLGLHRCAWAFSSCSEQVLLSSCRVQVSHWRGFSRAQALGCVDSVVGARGLSCPAACGILLDQRSNPCPLHWQVDSYPLDHQEVQWVSLRGTRKGRTPRTWPLRPLMSITYELNLCLPCRKEEGQDWSMVPPRMTGTHSWLSSCPLQPSEGMALRHQQHGASSLSWLSWVPVFLSWSQVQVYSLAPASKVQENKINNCKTKVTDRFWNITSPPLPSMSLCQKWK